jgi:putative ABC transport system permease protein
MNIGQAVIEALQSLTSNKLRSGLTILGIVIGVAAVIAMLAIGRGAQNSITDQINGIGSNLIDIMPGTSNPDVHNIKPLTIGDAEAMSDQLAAPHVLSAVPAVAGSSRITYEDKESRTQVVGTTPAYATTANEQVEQGQFIDETQQMDVSAVAVIGPDTAKNLFGSSDGVIDQVIRIDKVPFRVIGVLKSKGGSSFGNQDDRIIIPISTATTRLYTQRQSGEVDEIVAQATSSEAVSAAQEEISEILRIRHRTQFGLDDFRIFTQQQILDITGTILGTFTIFLGGIAAISLLVGGIGIMNIMLVSVTERTREIGLRKAMGARKRDIMIQFLTESIMLSLVGGIVGILLAWGIASAVGAIAAANNTPINPSIGLDAVLLATLFSTGVGLLFGLYPSNRAASLQPVEALRYE